MPKTLKYLKMNFLYQEVILQFLIDLLNQKLEVVILHTTAQEVEKEAVEEVMEVLAMEILS